MKLNLRPLNDRVVIRPIEADEVTAGGVILPGTAKEKPVKGKVIAVGPGQMLDGGDRGGLSVKTKDVVYFGKYAGTEITVDGEELKILRESDILAIES